MDHSYVIAPLAYKDKYPYMKGMTVCMNCGCWEETTGYATCEDFLKGMKVANHYLDTLLVLIKNMPVRVVDLNEISKGSVDSHEQIEDIPGLTPETIDRKAYDEFMKGL